MPTLIPIGAPRPQHSSPSDRVPPRARSVVLTSVCLCVRARVCWHVGVCAYGVRVRKNNRAWNDAEASEDGSSVVALVEGYDYIWTSSDSAASWTPRAGTLRACCTRTKDAESAHYRAVLHAQTRHTLLSDATHSAVRRDTLCCRHTLLSTHSAVDTLCCRHTLLSALTLPAPCLADPLLWRLRMLGQKSKLGRLSPCLQTEAGAGGGCVVCACLQHTGRAPLPTDPVPRVRVYTHVGPGAQGQ